MPIPVQSVVTLAAAALDAEGDDRYTFNEDYRPAINYAIEWLVQAFNQAFGDKKITPESLRELVKVKVWQANNFSRVSFNPAIVGHDMWTLLAVYPDPKVYKSVGIPALASPDKSVFMPALTHVSGKAAARLTLEEWNENEDNIFMPGNTKLLGKLIKYAYLDFADYSSSNYSNPVPFEIEVRPSVSAKFVSIAYLKQPGTINVIGDQVEFPLSLRTMLLQKTLNYISFKQSDQTSLYVVTDRDISQLASMIM